MQSLRVAPPGVSPWAVEPTTGEEHRRLEENPPNMYTFRVEAQAGTWHRTLGIIYLVAKIMYGLPPIRAFAFMQKHHMPVCACYIQSTLVIGYLGTTLKVQLTRSRQLPNDTYPV